jgi:protein involved in polysaccharide export with SLBB domain
VYNLPVANGDILIVGKRDKSQRFTVMGEVKEPKTFDWTPADKWTLLKALEKVGGPTKNADLRKGVIKRGYLLNPATAHDVYFDLNLMAKGKEQDIDIEAGDAIILPHRQPRPSLFQQLFPIVLHFLPLGL